VVIVFGSVNVMRIEIVYAQKSALCCARKSM